MAVVEVFMVDARTSAPTEALRPTLALIVTTGHSDKAVLFTDGDPKALVPTVRESPMKSNSDWPLEPKTGDRGAACAR